MITTLFTQESRLSSSATLLCRDPERFVTIYVEKKKQQQQKKSEGRLNKTFTRPISVHNASPSWWMKKKKKKETKEVIKKSLNAR